MGTLIAVGNLKGGTGKSTISVNLASALAEAGHKTMLIDADRQETSSRWYEHGKLPIRLAKCPLDPSENAGQWVTTILGMKGSSDRLVIDLPPQIGPGLASALLIADLFLVPITPSGIDLSATGLAIETLQNARDVRGMNKPACMLVPNRVDRRTVMGRSIHVSLARFGLTVGPSIRQRSVYVRAFETGNWIGDEAPGSSALSEFRVLRDQVDAELAIPMSTSLAA